MKENRTLEYKVEISRTFLKSVSAFANFGSGRIIFGVADDGAIVGLADPQSACHDIENAINDSIDPRPNYTLYIDEKKKTVTLEVEEGLHKPYLYKGKAYRRADTASVEVDKLELRRLVLEGENLVFEDLPWRGEELTFHYLEKRLQEVLGIEVLSNDLLKTLGLQNRESFNTAAALLADNHTFAGIDMACIGETEDIILTRESIAGVSVLQLFDNAMKFFEQYLCYERISGAERETIERVPKVAFREAMANALVHRTWDVSAPIKVTAYPDRVEMLSPGGLVSGMTVESFLEGRYSILRNPIVAEVFYRLGLVEKFGTGVRRIRRAYEGSFVAPQFVVSEDCISVTLPLVHEPAVLSADEELVLSAIPQNLYVARSFIDKKLGFDKAKTIRLINGLLNNGHIKSRGEGRARKYIRA